jgi:hypothetical protein
MNILKTAKEAAKQLRLEKENRAKLENQLAKAAVVIEDGRITVIKKLAKTIRGDGFSVKSIKGSEYFEIHHAHVHYVSEIFYKGKSIGKLGLETTWHHNHHNEYEDIPDTYAYVLIGNKQRCWAAIDQGHNYNPVDYFAEQVANYIATFIE